MFISQPSLSDYARDLIFSSSQRFAVTVGLGPGRKSSPCQLLDISAYDKISLAIDAALRKQGALKRSADCFSKCPL